MDFLAKIQQIEAFVSMFADFMNSGEHTVEEKKEFLANNQDEIKSCMTDLSTIREYIVGNDDPDDDKYIIDVDRLDNTLTDAVDHLLQESKIVHTVDQEETEETEEVDEQPTTRKTRAKKSGKKLYTHTILLSNDDVINVIAKTKKDLIDAITEVTDINNGVEIEAVYKVSFEEVHIKRKVTYTIE